MTPTLFLDTAHTPAEQALVTLDAPADARAVVVILPSGETASLRWDPLRHRWYERVPAGGELRVALYVMDAGGGTTRVTETVRPSEPEVLVEVEDGFTRVTVYADEPLTSLVVTPADDPSQLEVRALGPADDAWAHVFELPGMWEDVVVRATGAEGEPMVVASHVPIGG